MLNDKIADMFKHQLIQLESGLKVITVAMPGVQSITSIILANTGSRYENPQEYGIAHFFEHIVFKGTEKYSSPAKLASVIDGVGATFNAFTSKEYTGYYVKAASEHLSLSLDVLSDMIMRPLIKQEDIDREKGVIIEELNLYYDTPSSHVGNLFDRLTYANTGLSHDIIGNKDSILQINSNKFKQFLNKWYGLSNLVLVVAGDEKVLNKSQTIALIKQIFEEKQDDTNGRNNHKININSYLTDNPVSEQLLHVENRKTQQAHFVLGWPGLKRADERRFAYNILSVIMGGNMSSRLFSELREKRGLCYYVHSEVDQFHDGGIIGASAGVDCKRVETAIKVCIEEFKKVANQEKSITQKELEQAQDYISGKLILSMEDSQNLAQYFGMKQLLINRIEKPEEVLQKIQAVTLAEVQKLATELIKDQKCRLALIGPYKNQDKFAFAIK